MATIVVPEYVPSASEDAERIRKAVKGFGTDEKTLIAILAHRNAAQRGMIRVAYQELYQEDLIRRLESELTGNFERAMYRWMLDPLERDAVLAHVALKNSTLPDYRVIIELVCASSPDELLAIKRSYQWRYKRSLEEDVASHLVPGNFRKLLFSLVSTYRYDGPEISIALAKSEAYSLHEVIEGRAYNHDELIRILTTRSKSQLIATFNCYKDEYKTTITKGLSGYRDDEFLAALRVTIRCFTNPTKYFAKALRAAFNNDVAGVDTVTRIIVTRAEKNLKEIMDKYYLRNNVTLDDAVSKEASGDYKNFLLHLLGN